MKRDRVFDALLTFTVGIYIALATGCATSADRMREQANGSAAGMAVIDPAGVAGDLTPAVEEVLRWWTDRYPHQAEVLRSYFARGGVKVVAQAEPLVDVDTGRRAYELSRDNWVAVWWDTRDGGARFPRALRHGLGHVALTALAHAPGDLAFPDHHQAMRDLAYPWP